MDDTATQVAMSATEDWETAVIEHDAYLSKARGVLPSSGGLRAGMSASPSVVFRLSGKSGESAGTFGSVESFHRPVDSVAVSS